MTHPDPPSVTIGHWTDRGTSHVENEDCAAAGAVGTSVALILADGMGGRDRGGMAARVAVNTVSSVLTEGAPNARTLHGALEAAHVNIQHLSAKDGSRRLGAACAVALVDGLRLWMANTGDVRIYRVMESGGIVRLSRDHTLLQQRLDAGEIEWSRSQGHPDGRVLSGFLGQRGKLFALVEDTPLPLRVGDRLVLCTDGVGATVKDTEIGQLAAAHAPDLAARMLVALARERGSRDDATAVVALLGPPGVAPAGPLAVLELPTPEPTVLDRSVVAQLVRRRDRRSMIIATAGTLLFVAVVARLWTLGADAPPSIAGAPPVLRSDPAEPGPATPDAGPADVGPELPPARPKTVVEALARPGRQRQELLEILQGRHRQELLALGRLPALAADASLPPPLPLIFDADRSDEERALILAGHLRELVLDGDVAGLRRLDAETTFRATRPEVARSLLGLIEMKSEPLFQRWALEHLGR